MARYRLVIDYIDDYSNNMSEVFKHIQQIFLDLKSYQNEELKKYIKATFKSLELIDDDEMNGG